jgi:hypothetical protein
MMRNIFYMLWSAFITSGWWAYGAVIDLPLKDWGVGFASLWASFLLANMVTAFCLLCVTLEFIMELHKRWNS